MFTKNNLGYKTAGKKGTGLWSDTTVYRTASDLTHLGKIVKGKTSGNGHKRKPQNAPKLKVHKPNKWQEYNGLHTPVKTQEEHNIILAHLARETKMPKKSVAKETYPLTGILKCGFCGHYLLFQSRGGRPLEARKCWYSNPYGVKCPNMSSGMTTVNEAVQNAILEKIADLKLGINSIDKSRVAMLEEKLVELQKSLQQKEKAVDRERVAYEHELYTIEEYATVLRKLKEDKISICKLIDETKTEIEFLQDDTNVVKLDILEEFVNVIKNPKLTYKEQNELYKSILAYIEYKRTESGTELSIVFN